MQTRSLGALSAAATAALVTAALSRSAAAADPDVASAIRAAFDVSAFTVDALDVPESIGADLAVGVVLDGVETSLLLRRHSLRADSFQLLVDDGQRLVPAAAEPPMTFAGQAIQLAGGELGEVGRARASIRGGSLWAVVRFNDGREFSVQPVADAIPGFDPAYHVVTRSADVVAGDWSCGTGALPGLGSGELAPKGQNQLFGTGLKITEIAVDADVEYYAANASSVATTLFDIEKVLNGVEGIYESDVGITYEVTSLVVRTAEPDPYTTTDPNDLLGQFDSTWSASFGSVQRDIAHLFTGKNLDGSVIGIARLSSICSTSQGYGLSQSKFSGNLASRVGLTSHELGHNWSAQHCDGAGDCFIMCSGIGGCAGSVTAFGQGEQDQIIAFKNTRTCLGDLSDPQLPPFSDTFPSTTLSAAKWSYVDGAAANTGATNEPSAPNSLDLDAAGSADFQDDEIRSNFIQLGSAFASELSYKVERIGVESGEQFVVEYWNDAFTWVEINRLTSNGVNESAFATFVHALPSDSLHDEFRLRFRAEVNGTSDDWYVDDVAVVATAPPAPTITGVAPATPSALPTSALTVTGTAFVDVTGVSLGGTPLAPSSFFVASETTISVSPPIASALGPTNLVVTTGAGVSNAFPITVVANEPPLLLSPFLAFNGSPLTFNFAGDPGDLAFLVVNLNGQVFPCNGQSCLSPLILLQIPSLNAAGTGSLAVVPNGVPSATIFNTQFWFLDAGATSTSSLEATNVTQTQIF